MGLNSVTFHGTGGETAGSIAYDNKTTNCPTRGKPVNFEGRPDTVEISGKKNTGLKATLGIIGATALIIGGLGCARKYGANKNWLKWAQGEEKFLGKTAKTCHEWCKTVKGWGDDAINWVKNIGKK